MFWHIIMILIIRHHHYHENNFTIVPPIILNIDVKSVYNRYIGVPVAQWLELCVSSAKVVGLIPREHTY